MRRSRTRPFRARAVGWAALLVPLLVTACASGPLQEKSSTIQDNRPVAEVLVTSGSGAVTVSAWIGATVNVTRTVRYRGSTPPTTTVDLASGAILRVEYDCSGVPDCSVDTNVQVPLGTAVTVRTESGAISLTGLHGRVDVRTGSGAVTMADVRGDVVIVETSGAVSASGLTSAKTDVQTGSGAITLTFASAPETVQLRSSSGAITAHLPGGPYRVDAASTNGAVTVTVTQDPASTRTIIASSQSGSVTIAP